MREEQRFHRHRRLVDVDQLAHQLAKATPARQPAESKGGVRSTPSTTRKTLLPAPSHNSAQVLRNTDVVGPALVGPAQRRRVLGVAGSP